MSFSRQTLVEACDTFLRLLTQAEMDTLVLRLELEDLEAAGSDRSKQSRANGICRHVLAVPEAEVGGRPLARLIVEEAVNIALSRERFLKEGAFGGLFRSLERDGFTVERGELRPALPEDLDLPAADDEVHLLLARHGLDTALGHLDQAITAHAQGNWASANSQLRSFYESIFDEITLVLDPENGVNVKAGETRRQHLADLVPPFIRRDLNEWSDDGKNLINGILKRLHPQGAHPGLSDEDDSTFRLHLVLVTTRLFLRRLDVVLGGRS